LAEGKRLYADLEGRPTLRLSYAVDLDEQGATQSMITFDDAALRQQVDVLDRYQWFLHEDGSDFDFQRYLSFSDSVIVGATP
jgi:hypothetical protein